LQRRLAVRWLIGAKVDFDASKRAARCGIVDRDSE
jgi:hypothetical protein